jgi:hypothetical protein
MQLESLSQAIKCFQFYQHAFWCWEGKAKILEDVNQRVSVSGASAHTAS